MRRTCLALTCIAALLTPALLHAQSEPFGEVDFPSSTFKPPRFPIGSWTSLGTAGGPVPRARLSAYAIYDPVGQRMVVFGGWGNSYFDDTWSLSLVNPGEGWRSIATTGARPSARLEHTTVYDPVRHRMIIFGGKDLHNFFNDVWQLDLATDTWSLLVAAGTPPGPRESRAVYDPIRNRIVMFGGFEYPNHLNETWALNLAGIPRWQQLFPAGTPPPKRRGQTGIYDVQNDRMILFGGFDDRFFQNDLWVLNFSGTPTWQILPAAGTPPSPRYGHNATYDPDRQEMVVFGGWGGAFLNDLHVLSLSETPSWTQPPLTTKPAARDFHSMIFDAPRHRIVLFDGNDGNPLSDLWSFDPSVPSWTPINEPSRPGPAARLSTYPIVDPVDERLVLFGGWGNEYFDDTWSYSLADPSAGWQRLAMFGPRPSARLEHTTIYDPVRHRMLLFGGKNLVTFFNDVWQLDLTSEIWSPLPTVGMPPSPRESRAVYDPIRDRMVIFGGFGHPNHLNEIWALNLSGIPTWEKIEPGRQKKSGKHRSQAIHLEPAPRRGHGVVYDARRDRIVVFGGYDDQRFFNDVWSLRFSKHEGTQKWRELKPHGTEPTARFGHSTTYAQDFDQMVVFGGYDGQFLDDGYMLNLHGKLQWSRLFSESPGPSPRDFHGVIWDAPRSRLVLLGGNDGSPLRDLWSYGVGTGIVQSVDRLHRRRHDPDAALPKVDGPRFSLKGFVTNPTTVGAVAFTLAKSGRATLELFDIGGRHVSARVLEAARPGSHVVHFDSASLAPGMYVIRLRQGDHVSVARGVLLR